MSYKIGFETEILNLKDLCILTIQDQILSCQNNHPEEFPAISLLEELNLMRYNKLDSISLHPDIFIGIIHSNKDISANRKIMHDLCFKYENTLFKPKNDDIIPNFIFDPSLFDNIEFFTIFDYYKKTETLPIPSLVKNAIKNMFTLRIFAKQTLDCDINGDSMNNNSIYTLELLDEQNKNNLFGLGLKESIELDKIKKCKYCICISMTHYMEYFIYLTAEDLITIRTRIENLMETFDYPNDFFSKLDATSKSITIPSSDIYLRMASYIQFSTIKTKVLLNSNEKNTLKIYTNLYSEYSSKASKLYNISCFLELNINFNSLCNIMPMLEKENSIKLIKFMDLLDINYKDQDLYNFLIETKVLYTQLNVYHLLLMIQNTDKGICYSSGSSHVSTSTDQSLVMTHTSHERTKYTKFQLIIDQSLVDEQSASIVAEDKDIILYYYTLCKKSIQEYRTKVFDLIRKYKSKII